jgi:hypothetical protein
LKQDMTIRCSSLNLSINHQVLDDLIANAIAKAENEGFSAL